MKQQLALQLYTVREEAGRDFAATLKQVALVGYTAVEFAGFFDIPAAEMAALLAQNRLTACGAHIGIDILERQTGEMVQYLTAIGCRNAVIPYATFANAQDVDVMVSRIKSLLPKIKAAGLNLLYHNHAQEFEAIDGVKPIEAFLHRTEVMLELDTFWAHSAGEEVLEFMRKNRARIAIVHLKDGTGTSPCAIGEGAAPCKRIYDLSKELNIQHIVVENDAPLPSGIEDATRSIQYITHNF